MNSGVILSPPDTRDYTVAAVLPSVTLPPEVRLDSKLLSIRDQGWWPVCVAKSGASIMSAGYGLELSSVYLYAKCKAIDGIPDLPGTHPRVAMKIMHQQGCCLNQMLPYNMMNDPLPRITSLHDLEAEQRKIGAYARAQSLTDIKLALANGKFLMGVLLVGDNFMNYTGGEVIGPPTGTLHGYHAIVVCGYNDQRKALRIANSWGRWGDNGFAWLSYDVLAQALHWPEAWVVGINRPKTAEEIYPDRIFREQRRFLKKNS